MERDLRAEIERLRAELKAETELRHQCQENARIANAEVDRARAEEREECARVCEKLREDAISETNVALAGFAVSETAETTAYSVAAEAIRAREE